MLLLLGAVATGYIWIRIDHTMSEVNSLSTLPPRIQGVAETDFRGTPLANLPTLVPRPTHSGPPPTVIVPDYDGASPGGPVRQTAIALAASGSPLAGLAAAASPATPIPATGSPVAATPAPDGETQAEMMLATGMTFDTGPAQTAVAEAAAQRERTPTPSGS